MTNLESMLARPEPSGNGQLAEHLAKPKILTLDIETSPNVADVWGLWQQNVSLNQLRETGEVISFAGKWYGKPKVEFRSNFHDGHETMVQRAWKLMHKADAIVHWNGTGFDVKHLHREFLLLGLTPPSPHKDIDLLQVVRNRFRFASNKLQHVATQLGLGGKVEHEGHTLWVKCLAGDKAAWRRMKTYNIGDVVLTERVLEKLIPWIKNFPALGVVAEDDQVTCSKCSSKQMVEDGTHSLDVNIYRRYRCADCGGWSRGTKAIARARAVRGI